MANCLASKISTNSYIISLNFTQVHMADLVEHEMIKYQEGFPTALFKFKNTKNNQKQQHTVDTTL